MSTQPSSPPPSSPPASDPCLRPLISDLFAANQSTLAREVDRLDKQQWAFEFMGSAAIGLVLLESLGRALRDPELTAEERALILYLVAFFHGVFEKSPLIQGLIRQAFMEMFPAPPNGQPKEVGAW